MLVKELKHRHVLLSKMLSQKLDAVQHYLALHLSQIFIK